MKSNQTNFKKLIFTLLLSTFMLDSFVKIVNASREINNLLINDLNIIATKVDEIPETTLNLKLVLLAYECNDVKLNWKIQHNSNKISNVNVKSSNILNSYRKKTFNDPIVSGSTKIFGYQVVVREYLESGKPHSNKKGSSELNDDKTLRVYSSKFIDSNQNKFKLINLLRKDLASYHICLIIYIDVTETVAFEKQCVTFSLPNLSPSVEAACQKSNKKIPKTTTHIMELTTGKHKDKFNIHSIDTSSLDDTDAEKSELVGTQSQPLESNKTLNKPTARPSSFTKNIHVYNPNTNCEHVAQCRHYSNLLVAFVVCGILLATNVFMFTIIIIQNTIKLSLLREKLKSSKRNIKQPLHLGSQTSTYLDRDLDKSYVDDEKICCCSIQTLKSAFYNSCSDVLRAICCGLFNKSLLKDGPSNLANKNLSNNLRNFSTKTDLRSDITMSQGASTITRPGYILQLPNATLSQSSILNMSSDNKTTYYTRSTLYNKSNLVNNFNRRNNFRNMPFQQQQQQSKLQIGGQNQPASQASSSLPPASDESLISGSCLAEQQDVKDLENYDNEVFYHLPNKLNNSQISSAF